MKNLNRSSYSNEELKEMESSLLTGWSTAVLARRYSKKFKRSEAGVYNKIRQMREELSNPIAQPAVMEKPVQTKLDLKEPLSELNISRVEVFSDHIKLYINH
jgi:hypothetical protein